MSEIMKKDGADMMPPSLERKGFNFFDPVQFDNLQRACKLFAKSELVPDMYRESANNTLDKAIANCMIALEISSRIGASPLMVMQNLIVIYGRPSWSSKFLVATVNTCGRFNPLQYRFTEKGMLGMVEYTEYTKTWTQGASGKGYYKNEATKKQFDGRKVMDIECVAFTSAKGSDKVLESSPISIRMAIQEGWYLKNGSKWQTMARQMLMYRAASFWTSAYAPEISMGMHTVEEARDIQDADYDEVREEAAAVEREISDNANGQEISLDDGTTVDVETGEVQDPIPRQEQAPQAQKTPLDGSQYTIDSPGF